MNMRLPRCVDEQATIRLPQRGKAPEIGCSEPLNH
jgi:hypothetical protein